MKFKNIKKTSGVSTYQDNLFIAVSDQFIEMITTAGMSATEARRIVLRDVNAIMKELLLQAERDLYAIAKKK